MAVAGWAYQELAASGRNLRPCILGRQNSLLGGKVIRFVPLATPHFLIVWAENDFKSTPNGSSLPST